MEVTCMSCYHIFDGELHHDDLGWHCVCPKCGASFDVAPPEGTCADCPRGKKETIAGNGITEPPYIQVVRCPFDHKHYHHPDDTCTFTEQLKSMTKPLDFVNVQGSWFDDNNYVMKWGGGRDDYGDEFHYELAWQVSRGALVFSKVYEYDLCDFHTTTEEKAAIIKKMMELVLQKQPQT